MVTHRPYSIRDMDEVSRVFKNQELSGGIPALRDSRIPTIFSENDRVLAYGVLKIFPEAILILDKDCERKQKAQIIRQGLSLAIEESIRLGCDYLYAFSEKPSYSKILRNKYNFKECPGDTLILNLP